MIKAIVFDIGGVLVDLHIERCRKAFRDILGYSKIDELLDLSHQKGIYSDLEEGKITPDEFRSMILKDSRPGARPEEVDECMWALLGDMDEYKGLMLKELQDNYKLYLLSNNNPISMQACYRAFERGGVRASETFTDEFLSYKMKLQKPGRAIYESVVKGVGFPASEILFIDDSVANVEAAKSLGIKAFVFRQGDDLKTFIERIIREED